jgi:hypothetical protein
MRRTTTTMALAAAALLALAGCGGGDDDMPVFGAGGPAGADELQTDVADALEVADAADIDAAVDEFIADGLGLPGSEPGNSYDEAVHGVDTYGDDPELDALWDACADGDDGACDELFQVSPIDSGYEAFGDSCGGRQEVGTGRWCSED